MTSLTPVPTNRVLNEFDRTLNEGDAKYRQQLGTTNAAPTHVDPERATSDSTSAPTALEKSLRVVGAVEEPQDVLTVETHLIIRTDSGWELPLVASPAAVAPLLGKSDHGVRNDCIAGRIPTLPRASGSGAHHRIPVARLLDQLGVPYRIEPVGPGGDSKETITA